MRLKTPDLSTSIALMALLVSVLSAWLQFRSWTDFAETSIWEGGQTLQMANGQLTADLSTHTFFVNNGSDPVSVASVDLVLLGPNDRSGHILDAAHLGGATCRSPTGLSGSAEHFTPFTVEPHKIVDVNLKFAPITADAPAGWTKTTEVLACLSVSLIDHDGIHDVGAPFVQVSAAGSQYSSWLQKLLPR